MRDFESMTNRLRDVLEHATANRLAWAFAALTAVLFVATSWWLEDVQEARWEPLFPRVDAVELAALEAAFTNADLPAYRVEQGQLLVPAGKRALFLAVARESQCLPATPEAVTSAALDGGSLLEPAATREARWQHAREKSAALLLRNMPGVESAVVRFDQTKEGGIRGKTLTTATVGITTPEGDPLDAAEVHTIQNMLVTLKAGLEIENVLVADLRTGTFHRGATQSAELNEAQRQKALELQWRKKIQTVLAFVPEAEIAVHVVLSAENVPPGVRVSVSLPRSYLQQLRSLKGESGQVLTVAQIEQRVRQRIQAAVEPLLVGGTPVAVNFFDTPDLEADPVPVLSRRHLAWAVLMGTIVIALAYWLRRPEPKAPEGPELRIYEEAEDVAEPEGAGEVDELQSKLRAYVEEDPDAAAQSLADFIDRAS